MTLQQHRKDDHLTLARELYQNQSHIDFTQTRFVHHSLPQLDVADVSLNNKLGELSFSTPFFINAMTGGSTMSKKINEQLAFVAKNTGLAMASGSLSLALKDNSTIDTFKIIRQTNPTGLVFANLGVDYSVEQAKRAIDLLEAQALQLHINVIQELAMPEGDRIFSGWLQAIETLVNQLNIPVIVKEVGFGMSRETMHQLQQVGVQYIDVAGVGGTNFARIENSRNSLPFYSLNDWGQSAIISLMEADSLSQKPHLVASGGIHTPLDVVKCLALGADVVGVSGFFLHCITTYGVDETIHIVTQWQNEIKAIMTALGASTVKDLQKTDILLAPTVRDWCEARMIDWKKFANRC